MAFFPVLSFLFLLVFGSVDSWAVCTTTPFNRTFSCEYANAISSCKTGNSFSISTGCSNKCSSVSFRGDGGSKYCSAKDGRALSCDYLGNGGSQGTFTFNLIQCTTQCEADSVAGCPPGKVWSSSYCACVDPPPIPKDTTWHCQNAGGPEPGGFGGPRVAKLFKCYDGSCHNTRDLSGSCQDWGFCEDGVDDCEIADSLGTPPCGRSGSRFITSSKCVYACADGKDLSCTPVSTGYVAGNIYAGECPSLPPDGCRPSSSSSGVSSSVSSSPSSGASSSPSNTDWRDTINPGNGGQLDYTRILEAILDTLHRANVQRDFVLDLENNISLDLDNISNYSEYNYQQLSNLNSKGSAINSALVDLNTTLVGAAGDLSTSADLLGAINDYLHSDSLLSVVSGDTTYNPLLRDIKDALDSMSFNPHDTSVFVRDSVFARWFAEYANDSVLSGGIVGDALRRFVGHMDDFADSATARSCSGFLSCMSVYKDLAYCNRAWGVSLEDCADGGTPLDGIWTTETSILSTLFDFFHGDSTLDYTPSVIDSAVSFSPAVSAAKIALSSASDALDAVDISGMLSHARQLVDSAKKSRSDSVKIQPDSLWLDSADAAKYVSNILMPSGTSTECFVCHADLGTFGGLSDSSLSIHIDFSNFGGYDWCALIRAVVKIATLVVCISLTLGSWLAAFGYNPKNDA